MLDHLGELQPFNIDSLPLPNIESFPQRGDYRLLPCGATAFVAINSDEQQKLAEARNQRDYQSKSEIIICSKPFFVVSRTRNAHKIAKRLEKKGIPVERLRKEFGQFSIPLENDEYISERLGDSDLQQSLDSCREIEKRNTILRNYARLLTQIHLANVVYGPNHFGNVISNKELDLFLIDFKTSALIEFDWQQATADTIFRKFFYDLAPLSSNLERIGCNDKEIDNTLREVVNSYPVSKNERKLLLEKMTAS